MGVGVGMGMPEVEDKVMMHPEDSRTVRSILRMRMIWIAHAELGHEDSPFCCSLKVIILRHVWVVEIYYVFPLVLVPC